MILFSLAAEEDSEKLVKISWKFFIIFYIKLLVILLYIIDSAVSFCVLAWRLKDEMEYVPHFGVFFVLVVERNKILKILK